MELKINKENKEAVKWKQRFYREKKKNNKSPTPRKMAANIIKEGKSEIRRQLVFGCAIKNQLRRNSAELKKAHEKKDVCINCKWTDYKKISVLGRA